MKPELENLKEALGAFNGGKNEDLAVIVDAALRSAVRAILPGRQQKTNLAPQVETARKAFVRTLRRRAL